VKYIQVPHHGSKRNVGPTVLDRILGPKKAQEAFDKTAFVSAAKDGEPKHPARKVVNAFQRRGAKVFATKGSGLYQHSKDLPLRAGWRTATNLAFYEQVDE
jgi:beta-lactamase superfamily II metal-dependent hydrolase